MSNPINNHVITDAATISGKMNNQETPNQSGDPIGVDFCSNLHESASAHTILRIDKLLPNAANKQCL